MLLYNIEKEKKIVKIQNSKYQHNLTLGPYSKLKQHYQLNQTNATQNL